MALLGHLVFLVPPVAALVQDVINEYLWTLVF